MLGYCGLESAIWKGPPLATGLLAAVVGSWVWFGAPMHDLALAMGMHDRWCPAVDESGTPYHYPPHGDRAADPVRTADRAHRLAGLVGRAAHRPALRLRQQVLHAAHRLGEPFAVQAGDDAVAFEQHPEPDREAFEFVGAA